MTHATTLTQAMIELLNRPSRTWEKSPTLGRVMISYLVEEIETARKLEELGFIAVGNLIHVDVSLTETFKDVIFFRHTEEGIKHVRNSNTSDYSVVPLDRAYMNARETSTASMRDEQRGLDDARKETNKLMDMMNEGLPAEQVVLMCLKYMSESDVADMMDCNELSDRFNEDNN